MQYCQKVFQKELTSNAKVSNGVIRHKIDHLVQFIALIWFLGIELV